MALTNKSRTFCSTSSPVRGNNAPVLKAVSDVTFVPGVPGLFEFRGVLDGPGTIGVNARPGVMGREEVPAGFICDGYQVALEM